MIQLLIAVLSISISHAKVEDVADKILRDCEKILSETRQGKVTLDQMVDYLAWFEANLLLMESNQVPKTEEMRRLYNLTESQVFNYTERDSLSPIVSNVRRLSNKMQHFVAKAVALGPLKIPACINDLIADPHAVRSDSAYPTGSNCEITHVEFWPDAVKELHIVHPEQAARFFRGIRHGWARTFGQNGIKRMADIHANFIEVKDVMSPYRLIGCVEGNLLTIRKVIRKTDGGSLDFNTYKDLCK